MTITITSDVTGKTYSGDSYEKVKDVCDKEDAEFLKQKTENKSDKNSEQTKEISKLKKQMSDEIEEKTNLVNSVRSKYMDAREAANKKVCACNEEYKKAILDAYEQYKKAESEAKKKHDEDVNEIRLSLTPYENELKSATNERFSAVKKFNEKFGCPYGVRYTGEKAYNEYLETIRSFEVLFDSFYKKIDSDFLRFFTN